MNVLWRSLARMSAKLIFLLSVAGSFGTIAYASDVQNFVGSWVNDDENTSGMTRVTIEISDSIINLHGYGKCHPTDCDWGITIATDTGVSLTAVYESSSEINTLIIDLLSDNSLHVHSNGILYYDGNYEYEADYYFHREVLQPSNKLPSLGLGKAINVIDGPVDSETTFFGGASIGEEKYQEVLLTSPSENVDIQGLISVSPADIGKKADLLHVFGIECSEPFSGGVNTIYFSNSGSQNYSSVNLYAEPSQWMAELAAFPFEKNIILQNNMIIDVGKWQTPNIPCFSYHFFGYRLQDDTLVYSSMPIMVGIPSLENSKPVVMPISLQLDPLSWTTGEDTIQIDLIAEDADDEAVEVELLSPTQGDGYDLAYIEPPKTLMVELKPDFQGNIVLNYRATDGRLFSDPENITIGVNSHVSDEEHQLGSQDSDPFEYAAFESYEDDMDLLGAPGSQPTLPRKVDLSANFPIPGNQGRSQSCVGWATAYAAKSYQERVEMNWSLNSSDHLFSPSFIYNQINGGKDKGSNIVKAIELIMNKGAATLATMPFNDMDFRTQPSIAAFNEAIKFKAIGFQKVNGTMGIKAILASGQPVIASIASFRSLEHLRGMPSIYNIASGSWGGHAVTIVGYDDASYGGAFKIINSWGQDWGDHGYFWLPYSFAANPVKAGKTKTTPILREAFTLVDAPNSGVTPVEPTPTMIDLPNLQVSNWSMEYDPRPGGNGKLQYSVINTGRKSITSNAFDISLVLSDKATVDHSAKTVVYEIISDDMVPGDEMYRDAGNTIDFKFPSTLTAGKYYATVWVDKRSTVAESNERDNISSSRKTIDIVNTLPDLVVGNWYAEWDDSIGSGTWQYQVMNQGVSVIPANLNWDVKLVMSTSDRIMQNNAFVVASDTFNQVLNPSAKRENSNHKFNLFRDIHGKTLPAGTYHMAVWVDSLSVVKESNEANNISLGSDVVRISARTQRRVQSVDDLILGLLPWESELRPFSVSNMYNGLPLHTFGSKVEITDTLKSGRKVRILPDNTKPALEKTFKADNQVIFPITNRIAMPKVSETNTTE